MLHHPTLEKLQRLRLAGMHKALAEQSGQSVHAKTSREIDAHHPFGVTMQMPASLRSET